MQVSDMLDRLYTCFDALTEEHDVFKARTGGLGVGERDNGGCISTAAVLQQAALTLLPRGCDKLSIRMGSFRGRHLGGRVSLEGGGF